MTANGVATADNGSDIEIIDGKHSVSFLFQGGEPTLAGVEFFKAVIEEQQRAFAKFKGRVQVFNSIQTNACSLSEELVSLLSANHFFFGVSLDGPAHVHDAMRFYKNGRGSFDEVMKGIELLRRYRAEFNILCVVTDIVVRHIAEVYAFYKDHGFYNIQFIACLDAFATMPPHPCTTDPKPSAIPFIAVEQAEHYHDCSCAANSSSDAADHSPHSCGCKDNATALRVLLIRQLLVLAMQLRPHQQYLMASTSCQMRPIVSFWLRSLSSSMMISSTKANMSLLGISKTILHFCSIWRSTPAI